MKKIIATCAVLVMTASVFAQAPNKMSYQAIVRDGNNNLVSSTSVGMRISILQNSSSGTAVYVETQTPTSNANGLVSLEIGTGTLVSGDFTAIDWANGPFFIKSETDPAGGTNYTITGTSQLLSVPYALYAKTSGQSDNDFTHYLGEQFGGGIIYHLWKDANQVEHGLIVSLDDLGKSIWGDDNVLVGSQSPWNGSANSNAIISATNQSAANVCASYNGGGFSDWYLPSLNELNLLWANLFNVNMALESNNGDVIPSALLLWSSNEVNANLAWPFYTLTGSIFDTNLYPITKTQQYNVRAIRRF
ncbi:hypothetical protein C9994_02995 [Marivirga lumbricoides]|uniref:DUF1566 domain-containing protein n=1 Tax=Marivirga lumbricoides TaxID=1046115 RepID=A0A2T4DUF1_9BACT|nr:hypothetical protein C9994_02995 [Marivirga lumbricoides]